MDVVCPRRTHITSVRFCPIKYKIWIIRGNNRQACTKGHLAKWILQMPTWPRDTKTDRAAPD